MSHRQLDSTIVFFAAGVIPMFFLGIALGWWGVLSSRDAVSLSICIAMGAPMIVLLLRAKWPDVGEEFLLYTWWVLTCGSIAAIVLRFLVWFFAWLF